MSDLKTQPTGASVARFIRAIEDPARRKDCQILREMMARLTRKRATMWGDSIVGFGRYRYRRSNGWEGEFFLTGFSPRKQNLTVYIMPGFGEYGAQLEALGPHRHSVSCLYLKRLDGLDLEALSFMISDSVRRMREMYPTR